MRRRTCVFVHQPEDEEEYKEGVEEKERNGKQGSIINQLLRKLYAYRSKGSMHC